MLNDLIQLITSSQERMFIYRRKKRSFGIGPDVQYTIEIRHKKTFRCLHNRDSFPYGNTLIESEVVRGEKDEQSFFFQRILSTQLSAINTPTCFQCFKL
jgi:hypothetical protein